MTTERWYAVFRSSFRYDAAPCTRVTHPTLIVGG